MKVKFKLLNSEAVLPQYSKEGNAGLDLTITNIRKQDDILICSFGLSVEIPDGYVGLIVPRNTIFTKDLMLTDSVSVIDSTNNEELKALYKYTAFGMLDKEEAVQEYKVGDIAARLMIIPYPKIEPELIDELAMLIGNRAHAGSDC